MWDLRFAASPMKAMEGHQRYETLFTMELNLLIIS